MPRQTARTRATLFQAKSGMGRRRRVVIDPGGTEGRGRLAMSAADGEYVGRKAPTEDSR